MDNIPSTSGLIAKAPELAALIAVVFLFLKHMATLAKEQHEAMRTRDEFIKVMHDDHMVARTETRVALEMNARATLENTMAMQALRDALKDAECANFVPLKK